MKRMERILTEPIYQTYNNQGSGSVVLAENPSIRNWYLNEVMNLQCSRKFLNGFTSPEINIENSSWEKNPYLERKWIPWQFMKGYINLVIRESIDKGYFMVFRGIDDFYVEGKSWYREKHNPHDGLICGYDQNEKSYCICAYDNNWRYQKFWTAQKGWNRGRKEGIKEKAQMYYCAIKPKKEEVLFQPELVRRNLEIYLDSSMEKYPMEGEEKVFGVVVHRYLAHYVEKLADEKIPYERMDRRVFRLIWEHKKVMLERIKMLELRGFSVEEEVRLYEEIVKKADFMRMLYASHHKKRRDSVLPILHQGVLELMEEETRILYDLSETLRKELKK